MSNSQRNNRGNLARTGTGASPQVQQTVGTLLTYSRSGPLPDPDTLRGYEAVVPGSAERILNQALKQSDHRIAMETLVIEANTKHQSRGQVCGVIVILAVLAVAAFAIAHGQNGAALIAAAAGVITLGGAQIYSIYAAQRERAEKRKAITEHDQAQLGRGNRR